MIDDAHLGGVIYPLMYENFILLKSRKNPVYIKYPARTLKKASPLKKGNILLLYQSKANKSIIAFGIIKNVSLKLPDEIKSKYLDKIQMEKDQFNNYISGRESKELLFIELDKIIEFNKPVISSRPITMAGLLIDKNEVNKIMRNGKVDI